MYKLNINISKIYVVLFFLTLVGSLESQPNIEKGFSDIVKPLLPAVVSIEIKKHNTQSGLMGNVPPGMGDFFKKFFGDRIPPNQKNRAQRAMGSGFVFDSRGYILTNNHVIDGAEEIFVYFGKSDSESKKFTAKLIGSDPRTDIAVLKIEGGPFPFVNLGNIQDAKVGDWVIAVGNPFGLGSTVTKGIVSQVERELNNSSPTSYVAGYIQFDAPVNTGNSGGPLFNIMGEVVGVINAIVSPTGAFVGIGFAIPVDVVKLVVKDLMKYGRAKRAWLGVTIQKLTTDLAKSFSLSAKYDSKGALVSSINDNSPASQAGIIEGDIILEFDGKRVDDTRKLPRVVGETPINKVVAIKVWRNKKEKIINVKVAEYLDDNNTDKTTIISNDSANKYEDTLGLQLREEKQNGKNVVLVDKIISDQYEDVYQMQPGDVIKRINNIPVKSINDVKNIIKKAKSEKKYVLSILTRNKMNITGYLSFDLDKKTQKQK